MEYLRSKFFGAVRKNTSDQSGKQENGSKVLPSGSAVQPLTAECISSIGASGTTTTSEFFAPRNIAIPLDVNRAAFRLEDNPPSTSRQLRCPTTSEIRSRSRGRRLCSGSQGKGLCSPCHGITHNPHNKFACTGTEPCESREGGAEDHVFLKVHRPQSGSAHTLAYAQHDQGKTDGSSGYPRGKTSPRDRPKSSKGKKKKKRDSRPQTTALHLGHPPRNRAQSFNFLKSSRNVVNRHAYCPNEPGVHYPPPPWEHGMRKRWCSIDRGTGGPPLVIPQPKKSKRKRMHRRVMGHEESFMDTPVFRHPVPSPMKESSSTRSTSPPKKTSPPRSPPRIVTPSPPPYRLPSPPRATSPPRASKLRDISPPRSLSPPSTGPYTCTTGPCVGDSSPVATSDMETQCSGLNIPPTNKVPTKDVSCSSATIRLPCPENNRACRVSFQDEEVQTGHSLGNVPVQIDPKHSPASRGPPPYDNMVQLPIVSSPSHVECGSSPTGQSPALTYCPAALADPQTPRAYLAAAAVAAVAAAAARVCSPPPSIVLEVDESWAQQHAQPPCKGGDKYNNPHPCSLGGICGCGRHGPSSQQRLLKSIEDTLCSVGTCRSRRDKSRGRRDHSSSPSRRDSSPYVVTSSSSTRFHPSKCDFFPPCKSNNRPHRDMSRPRSPHNVAQPPQHPRDVSPHRQKDRQQGDSTGEQPDSECAIKCIHACSGCGLSLYATASDSSGGVIRTLSRQLREKNSPLCACPPTSDTSTRNPPPPQQTLEEKFGGSQLCEDFRCDAHNRENCRRDAAENYRRPEYREDKIPEEMESSREA